jgi:hypothetical protein
MCMVFKTPGLLFRFVYIFIQSKHLHEDIEILPIEKVVSGNHLEQKNKFSLDIALCAHSFLHCNTCTCNLHNDVIDDVEQDTRS